MFYYLKGVDRFKRKNYISAKHFFEKASKYNKFPDYDLFYQYYGQTLFYLNQIDESFNHLSKAYKICDKRGWDYENDREYNLTKDTLELLQYIKEVHNLEIEGFIKEKRLKPKKESE